MDSGDAAGAVEAAGVAEAAEVAEAAGAEGVAEVPEASLGTLPFTPSYCTLGEDCYRCDISKCIFK